jgi:hypothetical protein
MSKPRRQKQAGLRSFDRDFPPSVLEMPEGILIQLVPFLVPVKNFLLPLPVANG